MVASKSRFREAGNLGTEGEAPHNRPGSPHRHLRRESSVAKELASSCSFTDNRQDASLQAGISTILLKLAVAFRFVQAQKARHEAFS